MPSSFVTATVRYLIPTGSKPIYIASQGGADAALNIGAEFEDRNVDIYNARALESPTSLDREGFELRNQATLIEDFYQIEQVRESYDSEVIALVLSATGAQEAMVFDHTLRSDSRAVRGIQNTREPASVIHNDYSDNSARKRLTDLLPAGEAKRRLQRRFAIVNVWRSINGVILDSALACCDARSIADEELIASERRAAERVGELQLVSWGKTHRWYYFPHMQPDETLLIKTFDSSLDGRARRSVHTAFHDPSAPVDVPARESIESRLLVFFE